MSGDIRSDVKEQNELEAKKETNQNYSYKGNFIHLRF